MRKVCNKRLELAVLGVFLLTELPKLRTADPSSVHRL